MSDISVLSNQYEKLVLTSDKINNSVIALKKDFLLQDSEGAKKYPRLSLTREEVAEAKQVILSFLDNVMKVSDEGSSSSDYVPSIIFEDYKQRLQAFPYLEEDVSELIQILGKENQVNDKNLNVLDELLAILDFERSTLFRRLRTARG